MSHKRDINLNVNLDTWLSYTVSYTLWEGSGMCLKQEGGRKALYAVELKYAQLQLALYELEHFHKQIDTHILYKHACSA